MIGDCRSHWKCGENGCTERHNFSLHNALSGELESCRQWVMDNGLSLHLGGAGSVLFGSKRKLKGVESFDVECGGMAVEQLNM